MFPPSVRAHALNVLRGREAHRIRFQYTGYSGISISVAPETFERIARAIEENRIRLDGPEDLGAGEDGCYWSGNFVDSSGHAFSGRFSLNIHNTGSRIWDAVLIHEAVHASFDLTRSRLSLADDEAAAYIASAMFCHMTGLPLHRWRAQMGNELEVRTTARRAIRNATITTQSEINALRQAMISAGYDGSPENPFPMGTLSSPTVYTGSG